MEVDIRYWSEGCGKDNPDLRPSLPKLTACSGIQDLMNSFSGPGIVASPGGHGLHHMVWHHTYTLGEAQRQPQSSHLCGHLICSPL